MTRSLKIKKYAYFDKVGYEPFDGQRKYHDSKARFRIPAAGRRFGKSTMVARDRAPSLMLPNTRGWIIGPSYTLAAKEFRVIWDDVIIKLGLGSDKRVKRNFNERQGDMYIRMPWGSEVVAKSAQNDDQLVGDELSWVIFSEAAKHKLETWQRFIRPALIDSGGEADFPSTPEGYNWFYELWELGHREDAYESFRFPSWLNHVLFPGGREDPEIKLLERTMLKEWFEQEIAADFASFVGKIFGEFNPMEHVDEVKYDPNLPNYIAFDWGYTNPLAAVEFQVANTPSGECIRVWREHYKSFETLDTHIQMMKAREQPDGYSIDLTFGDPADPGAIQYVSKHLAPCVGDAKMKENWMTGVNIIKKFLEPIHDGVSYDDYERPVKYPRYVVDKSCENHIREMSNYRAKENVKTEIKAGSVVAKVDDHTVDAMRYALVYLFDIGTHHLSDIYRAVTSPVGSDEGTHFQYGGDGITTGMRF